MIKKRLYPLQLTLHRSTIRTQRELLHDVSSYFQQFTACIARKDYGQLYFLIAVGVTYNEDMSYAFGAPLTDGLEPFGAVAYSRGDKAFSESVLRYWTNFIKTGSVARSKTKRSR